MAMAWMSGVSQTAVAQEARQFAVRHKDPTFAPVVAQYRVVGFDVVAAADRLLALSDEALSLRGSVDAAQARYEVESAQHRDAVARVAGWLRKLQLAARYAAVSGHPAGPHLQRLLAHPDLQAESAIGASGALREVLDQLGRDDLSGYGLGPAFVAEGRALLQDLLDQGTDTVTPESQRLLHTTRLHQVLDEIVALFERIAAAREFAMEMTGADIPGFSLTFVRGAQGGTAAPAPAAPDDKGL